MAELTILAPAHSSLSNCVNAPLRQPFAPQILAFIQVLSKLLLSDSRAKALPELVALGFWLRNSHIQQLKETQQSQSSGITKALGLVLHFTPANVDTMFVYSWICSLLMGNNNIVRVASADSAAKNTLLQLLNQVLNQAEFADVAQSNLFVTYPKEATFSAELSLLADARVIWGGDDSVNAIRSLPIKPRCRDISFADRYSAALVNGNALVDKAQVSELAALLWRDTQPHAQQACSSPRVIFWLGNTSQQQALFSQINLLASGQAIEINGLNNHLVVSQLIQSSGLADKPLVNRTICALPVECIKPEFLGWHLGSGLFLIKHLQCMLELPEHIDNKLQTLSYWQVEQKDLLKLVEQPSITGLDRIVPVGRALD
ncbi:acyl-CoA reductase, partial [Paraglaciecola sp.]|uniref:acyl-CoA reductase n=1 Tax=Paraglaciecola sp. TaxID=1920173 RepID=UPI00273EDEE6